MQVPKRKPGIFKKTTQDPFITKEKYEETKFNLAKLKNKIPKASEEVSRLAEMGDFSENHAYQMAKGRLRSMLYKIDELKEFLKTCKIIKADTNSNTVQIGNIVTLKAEDKEVIYQILGSSETDPSKGIISQNSKLGSELLGLHVGDMVKFNIGDKTIEYKVLKIK